MNSRPRFIKVLPLLLTLLTTNERTLGETTQTSIDVTTLANGWVGTTGTYSCNLGTIPERYQSYEWAGSVASNTLSNLPNGTYEVEVYCNASEAWKSTAGITDDNRSTFTELTVNDVAVPIPAYTTNTVTDPTLYTLTATVTNGDMSIALRNLVKGPNWFIMKLNKVTLISPAETGNENTTLPECVTVNNKQYLITGENLINNGSFEQHPMLTWTSGAGTPVNATNFRYGNGCLTARTNSGAASAGSIKQAWPIEKNKTYIFSFKERSANKVEVGTYYQVLSLTNNATTENTGAVLLGSNNTVNGNPTVTTDGNWTTNTIAFTNDQGYAYALFSARWLASSASFDDFYLAEAEEITDPSATLLTKMQETEAAAEPSAPEKETATATGSALTTEQGNAALQLLADNNIPQIDLAQLSATNLRLTNPEENANLLVLDAPIDIDNTIRVNNGTLQEGSVLTDKAPFISPTALSGTLTYTRSIAEGNEYGTLILPFEVNGTDETQFYELKSAKDDILYFEETPTVSANTPVMYHTTQSELTLTGDGISATTPQVKGEYFTGTYRTIDEVPQDNYILSDGQYWLVDSPVRISPFRAYLHDVPSSASASLRYSIGMLYTGIVSTPVENATSLRILGGKGNLRLVNGTTENTVRLYSLGGQLLHTLTLAPQETHTLPLPAGTYLANGIKILVY